MNQPWIYMYPPSQYPLPPPTPPNPTGSSQCTKSEHLSHASNLGWWSVSRVMWSWTNYKKYSTPEIEKIRRKLSRLSPLNTLIYSHSSPQILPYYLTTYMGYPYSYLNLFVLYLLALLTCSKISLQQSSSTLTCTVNFLLCWIFLTSVQIFLPSPSLLHLNQQSL